MKCPECEKDRTNVLRHAIEVECCPNDHGMWFTLNELEDLENEAFVQDDEKGSLILSSTQSKYKCPACNSEMKRFLYRMYDIELEYCENEHGFWLEAGEDDRVLQLMNQRKRDMERKLDAELHWQTTIRHLQSNSIFQRLKSLMKG